ncbi:Retrotransposon nucleocapsid protein, related [Phytophthora megakarya]|uniref:Retrotransposon nucleocapsid protein, related n=1 Tax=Phytophthora megakarya TaxID=4795 RepID=A0A225UYV3_9STRA|nr:Retrotransposon nucleocapsid protein, related [Phytophthora megakarya]
MAAGTRVPSNLPKFTDKRGEDVREWLFQVENACVDRLTKRCHFVPTTKKVTAEGVARLVSEHIWKWHGMPTNIVSDRDRKFVSAF